MNLHEELAMKTEALKRIDKIISDFELTMTLPNPKQLKEIWWIIRTALCEKQDK